MSENRSNITLMYVAIFGALLVWSSYLAIGSYLSIAPNKTNEDLTNDAIIKDLMANDPAAPETIANKGKSPNVTKFQPRFDWRKPVLVLGTMLAFLGFWALALRNRSLRLARESEQAELGAIIEEQE